jgi:hypothetical protein
MASSIGKVTQSGTVLQEMLTKATFNQTNFLLIFSHFCDKILVLIFNMFLYAKIGHSKLVEMHGALQICIDLHPSPIGILYSQLG